jgi:transcriptional regulator with XRE-family HTH domain
MSPAATLIRTARLDARLTQAELGARLGTTQGAIARLEGAASNPTVATLGRVLRATGRRLDLRAVAQPVTVDEAQIATRLAMTPAQRLASFTASQRNLKRLVGRATRVA